MAVLRIQSIKISDLSKAVVHRKNPGEATPYEEFIASDCFIDEEEKDFLFYGLGENPNRIKLLLEIYQGEGDIRFFEAIESVMFSRKIRKNATIQEIVISYDSEESAIVEEDPLKGTSKDIFDLLEAFKEVCGFKPFLTRYIHRDKETGRYHVHILFSLMNPITGCRLQNFLQPYNKYCDYTKINATLCGRLS